MQLKIKNEERWLYFIVSVNRYGLVTHIMVLELIKIVEKIFGNKSNIFRTHNVHIHINILCKT